MAIFDLISGYISQTVQNRDILWNANRNLLVLYRLVLFPVTLSDAKYPKPPRFRHFVLSYVSS